MKKNFMLLILCLVLIMVTSQVAVANCVGNCAGHEKTSDQNQQWEPLAGKLNLTDQQVQQLKELNLNTYQTTKALKIKLMDAKFELRQLGIEGTDKTAISAKIKEIKALKAQIKKVHEQKKQKFQSILTAQQQSKLQEMKAFGGHHGRKD